jgi:flavin-dependent dehydrogenase
MTIVANGRKIDLSRPVRIAGAGPSGLSAAITLARAGVPVEVHEKGKGPGCRHHFDFQGIENWSWETDIVERLRGEMGLALDCPLYPVNDLHLIGPDLKEIPVHTEKPLAYLVQRGFGAGTLEDTLIRQAESLGVRIHCGSELGRQEADIWATGPPSATGVAAGYTFKTDHPPLSVCLLHKEYAPGGYVYLLVAGGKGTLATVLLRSLGRARQCLDKSRQLLCEKFGLEMEGVRGFGGIGFFRPLAARQRRALLVGEAGGFQDVLFGFGIHMALVTGHLAGRSLLEEVSFRTLCERGLQSTLRAGLANRFLFELGGRVGHRYLIRQAAQIGVRNFLSQWYRFGVSKTLMYPLARMWFHLRFREGSPRST